MGGLLRLSTIIFTITMAICFVKNSLSFVTSTKKALWSPAMHGNALKKLVHQHRASIQAFQTAGFISMTSGSASEHSSFDVALLAKDFIQSKNDQNLFKIFENLEDDAIVYGTKGKVKVQDELGWFFFKHPELHHEVIGDYQVVAPNTVQYQFIKSWVDPDTKEKMTWDSSLPEKNKVERIVFSEKGKIKEVSVVKLSEEGPDSQSSVNADRHQQIISLAKQFINDKNSNNLMKIYGNLDQDAVVYGTKGKVKIQDELSWFFFQHPELHHEVVGDYEVMDANTVQYKFIKSWVDPDSNEKQNWDSSLPDRNKVERIVFTEEGKIKDVSVTKLCSPVEMGQHFIETRNANNLQGLFELFREDVDAYGHQGRAAAEAAFHAFHEAHPGLAHELQGPFQEVAGPAGGAADAGGAVRYQYLKRWRDPETGEPQQWDAVAKGKAEQLELDGHGRIRRIEIIKLEG